MNRLTTLLSGIFLVFLTSWLGLVAYSAIRLGTIEPLSDVNAGTTFPPLISGNAIAGQYVYATEGCVSCHSQQVRQKSITSADVERNWGLRPSVARDYLREKIAFLGANRIGQDLSNIGMRKPDANWHYLHLYKPASASEGSLMPSYSYLFTVHKIQGERSSDALDLQGEDAPKPGYEILPTPQAKHLVSYLLSLRHDYALPEAPLKTEDTK